MKIAAERIDITCPEADIYNRLLSLDDKCVLELGCGNADITRDIAGSGSGRKVAALEVDEAAHNNNLQIADLPNVTFGLAGAENIPLEDESVDVVFMFKSLHHVPIDLMDQAMWEIQRVLKPGGLAYISEPIFSGDFNEILRLFHDEKKVREAAFNTLKKVVDQGVFSLVEEVFFNCPIHFKSFSDYDNKVIGATHSSHQLDDEVYTRVKRRFHAHLKDDGAYFALPIRVDLLQRPLIGR
jgi:ubiquinone/menaquinone biosynthesis C-methylase UbiE